MMTVQECLAKALDSYQEQRRQCARLDWWWEQAICNHRAWRDYQREKDMCLSGDRPMMPVLPVLPVPGVPVPNPQGRPVA
jgi:hypothetical protein